MISEEKKKFSSLMEQIERKLKPFETLLRDFTITIIAVIVADIMITILLWVHIMNMFLQIYVHTTLILSAFGISYFIQITRMLKIIKEVDNFLKSAEPKRQTRLSILVKFIKQIDNIIKSASLDPDVGSEILKNELLNFKRQIDNIHDKEGAILSTENAQIYFESLYKRGTQYFSTDVHVPSQFKESQNWFLNKQQDFQIRNQRQEGKRILIVEEKDIKYDYILKRQQFEDFVKNHKDMNVTLRVAEPDCAEYLRNEYKLESKELAIWIDTYAAHYDRILSDDSSSENLRVRIILYRKDNDNENYNRCLSYFNELFNDNKNSKPIQDIMQEADEEQKENPRILQESTPQLADVWDRYIDWQIGPPPEGVFLTTIIDQLKKIPSKISILDAAAATGRETIFLYKHGYKIHANNIDSNFRSKLFQNLDTHIGKNHVDEIQKTQNDWVLFSHYFKDHRFDVVILIGNFLSRLLDQSEIRRTIDQCFKILKPGGIFIVDRRNFDRIIAHKDEGICCYNGFYEKIYKGKYLFCGRVVRGWPKSIENDKIEFVFGDENRIYGPSFIMYPFKCNTVDNKNCYDELKELLDRRFERVEVYADYDVQNGISQNPAINYTELDADFIVYVAHKPQTYY
jgi:SAM-dependent methyltransferase